MLQRRNLQFFKRNEFVLNGLARNFLCGINDSEVVLEGVERWEGDRSMAHHYVGNVKEKSEWIWKDYFPHTRKKYPIDEYEIVDKLALFPTFVTYTFPRRFPFSFFTESQSISISSRFQLSDNLVIGFYDNYTENHYCMLKKWEWHGDDIKKEDFILPIRSERIHDIFLFRKLNKAVVISKTMEIAFVDLSDFSIRIINLLNGDKQINYQFYINEHDKEELIGYGKDELFLINVKTEMVDHCKLDNKCEVQDMVKTETGNIICKVIPHKTAPDEKSTDTKLVEYVPEHTELGCAQIKKTLYEIPAAIPAVLSKIISDYLPYHQLKEDSNTYPLATFKSVPAELERYGEAMKKAQKKC